MVRRSLVVILSAALMLFYLGCSDGGSGGGGAGGGSGGFGLSDKPVIETEVGGQSYRESNPADVTFLKGQVEIDGTVEETIRIKNVAPDGSSALNISNISLAYEMPLSANAAEKTSVPAIRIVSVTHGAKSVDFSTGVVSENITAGGADSLSIVVAFKRYDDIADRSAKLTVKNNSSLQSAQSMQVGFVTKAAQPAASISPELLDFGLVGTGEQKQEPITVANTGSSNLEISKILFSGNPDYELGYGTDSWKPGEDVVFDPPVIIEPDSIANFVVRFKPEGPKPAEAQAVFLTNDPKNLTGILVEIKANTEGPAIQVNPKKVQFGGKLVGQKALLPVEIKSIGTADLEIYGIELVELEKEDGSGNYMGYSNFKIDTTTLAGFEDGSVPSTDKPLPIKVNYSSTFNVTYTPSIENPVGDDGQHNLDGAAIVIKSNAFDSEIMIQVTGLGVDKECPTAVVVIQEGEQVIPQTNLHLFGDQSFAPSGAIASWKWSVEQPAGSASVFIPSDTFPNPTFEVNIAGEYLYSLDVWDEAGVKSCVPFKQNVLVIPDEAIHVELLWHTPNDPDETDQGPEAGSDCDLHFLHDKYAASGPDLDKDGKPDGWFDQPFDCFWFNAHPNWGSFDPSIDDDPGLDRDDTDGAGPENLNLNIPENTTYRVGVHYWSDHEYGPSFITVRIYIYSNLVFEVSDVKLVNHDMWDVATIDWPSGKVTLVQVNDAYKITPDYQNPFFFQP